MIVLPTKHPEDLLQKMKEAIDDRKVRSWSYDADGDFTHTAEQWVGQAWLRPEVANHELRFYIVPPKDTHISGAVYAIYHGRLIEMAIRHFDEHLSGNASASPLPEGDDQVS